MRCGGALECHIEFGLVETGKASERVGEWNPSLHGSPDRRHGARTPLALQELHRELALHIGDSPPVQILGEPMGESAQAERLASGRRRQVEGAQLGESSREPARRSLVEPARDQSAPLLGNTDRQMGELVTQGVDRVRLRTRSEKRAMEGNQSIDRPRCSEEMPRARVPGQARESRRIGAKNHASSRRQRKAKPAGKLVRRGHGRLGQKRLPGPGLLEAEKLDRAAFVLDN